jgi:hypothetical protein
MVGLRHPLARVLPAEARPGSFSLSGRQPLQGLRAESSQDGLDDRRVIEQGATDRPRFDPRRDDKGRYA